jgi:transposase InsO family protein
MRASARLGNWTCHDSILDTGAAIGLVTQQAANAVLKSCKHARFKPANSTVSGVGGKAVKAVGHLHCSLEIAGGILKNTKFIVIEGLIHLDHQVLVSNGQLEALKATIDYRTHTVKAGGKKVFFSTYRTQQHHKGEEIDLKRWSVSVAEDATIEPHTTRLIRCNIWGPRHWGKQPTSIVLTGDIESLPEHVNLAGGLHSVSTDRHFLSRIFNSGFGPCIIHKGAVIAFGEDGADFLLEDRQETVLTSAEAVDRRSTPPALESPEEIQTYISKAIADNKELGPEQRKQLKALLLRHSDVFANSLGGRRPPGAARTPPHQVRLTDPQHPPIRSRPHRLSAVEDAEIEKTLDKLLTAKVIEPAPAACPWAAPVVMVRRRGSDVWRFCIDYRKLNAITVRDPYPLPRIDEILQQLQQAQWFTTLDLVAGYWQIPMHENSKEKTAFITKRGLFVFRVVPFGLCNAPSSFQHAMDAILGSDIGKFCFCYIDDIVIFSKRFEDHLRHLDSVLQKLAAANWAVKLQKCKFGRKDVLYLGHVVDGTGIRTNPDLIKAVQESAAPTNRKQVQSWLGLTGYYRQFIDKYATIAEPLQRLVRSDVKFEWNSDQQQAFEALKKALTSAPVLHHYDPSRECAIRLDVDASGPAIGAVFSQRADDGLDHPVAFGSHLLDDRQKHWSIAERECYAIVHFIRHWKHYLYGRHFTVFTDHKALQNLANARDPRGKLARWHSELQEFDFTIVYLSKHANKAADAMTRPPIVPTQEPNLNAPQAGDKLAAWLTERTMPVEMPQATSSAEAEALYVALTASEELAAGGSSDSGDGTSGGIAVWHHAQAADEQLGPIISYLRNGTLPQNLEEATKVKSLAGHMCIGADECLYYLDSPKKPNESNWRMVVPASSVDHILFEFHDGPGAGHRAHHLMLPRLEKRFWWPNMAAVTREYIKTCAVCQERSQPRGKRPGLLQPIQWATRPATQWAMDTVDMPKSLAGNHKMIVSIDTFSRYIIVGALPNAQAETTASWLIDNVIYRHGVPEAIHSDQGSEFDNQVMRRVSTFMGINKTTISARHPQGNGICERVHRTLLDTLAKNVSPDQKDWDLHLQAAVFAYNSSPHSSTGESPYFLMHGRDARSDIDAIIGDGNGGRGQQQQPAQRESLSQTVCRLEQVFIQVAQHIHDEQQKQKKYYDQDRKGHSFVESDLVLLHNPSVGSQPGQRKKLLRQWKGPYRVRRIFGTGRSICEIQNVNKPKDIQKVSVQRLKHFYRSASDDKPMQPDEFEVESIDDVRPSKSKPGKQEFLIKFKNFQRRERQWIIEDNINAPELMDIWKRRQAVVKQQQQPQNQQQQQRQPQRPPRPVNYEGDSGSISIQQQPSIQQPQQPLNQQRPQLIPLQPLQQAQQPRPRTPSPPIVSARAPSNAVESEQLPPQQQPVRAEVSVPQAPAPQQPAAEQPDIPVAASQENTIQSAVQAARAVVDSFQQQPADGRRQNPQRATRGVPPSQLKDFYTSLVVVVMPAFSGGQQV